MLPLAECQFAVRWSIALREVLFDVDGVLVHPWRFRDFLIREHQIQPEMTLPFFRGPFGQCAVGKSDLAKELPSYLAEWGWSGSLESFIDSWLSEENAPNSIVLDYVVRLRDRGIRCHVVSTQEPNRARYLAQEMGFAKRFESLLFSCDLGAAKPDPEYFRRAASRIGQDPSRLLLVDDAVANVEAARAEGWEAVLYQGPEDLDKVSVLLETASDQQSDEVGR